MMLQMFPYQGMKLYVSEGNWQFQGFYEQQISPFEIYLLFLYNTN